MKLAARHWETPVGASVDVTIGCREEQPVTDVVIGAGFEVEKIDVLDGRNTHVRARRARSLPDTVGPNMRVLVCGLNPSEYSADRGVGYARPGNRFWPAAVKAKLVTRALDPVHALEHDGVGITDIVKRATVRASELSPDEYRAGLQRVERLVAWLQPRVVCFVGLDGWRTAVDRKAVPGRQPRDLAGAIAYVMPSTSGLNARTRIDELVAHLRTVRRLAR